MAHILMINLPFSGHVNPTLPLAEALVNRGHRIDYICSEQFRQKIESTGAEFVPYRQFPDHPTENEKMYMAKYDTRMYNMVDVLLNHTDMHRLSPVLAKYNTNTR